MRYMNYKPGWWAVYFFYCSIPVAIYVWYLCRRCEEVFPTKNEFTISLEKAWVTAANESHPP